MEANYFRQQDARLIERLRKNAKLDDIAAALAELRAQYDTGADPMVVLTDLAEFAHFVTRMKIVPAVGWTCRPQAVQVHDCRPCLVP